MGYIVLSIKLRSSHVRDVIIVCILIENLSSIKKYNIHFHILFFIT